MKNIYLIHFDTTDEDMAYTTYEAAKLRLIKEYLHDYVDDCNECDITPPAITRIIDAIIDEGFVEDYAYISPIALYGE